MYGRSRSRARTRPARGGARASALALPTTSLTDYWESDDDAYLALDGSGFAASWTGKHAGNALSQATGTKQPKRLAAQQNGLAGLDFDAGDCMASNAIGAAFAGTDVPFTVWFALTPDNVASTRAYGSFGSGAATVPYHLFFHGAGTGPKSERIDDASSTSSLTGTVATTTAPQLIGFVFTGTTVAIRRNGAEILAPAPQNHGACTFTKFTVGALGRTTDSTFFDGRIFGVYLYSGALDASAIASVEAYVNGKWALY
jgi:hypothetical protein